MLKKSLTYSLLVFACLLVVIFLFSSSKGLSQIHEEILFQDDFEDSIADGWWFWDKQGNFVVGDDSPWSIIKEGNNYILRGSGHNWAVPNVSGWMNYSVEARIKLIVGSFHFNVRQSPRGYMRYFIGINEGGFYLSKQTGENDFFDLAFLSEDISLNTWYSVKIVLNGANIKVYLNDNLKIDYTDEEDPILFGRFAFETLDDSEVYFDDILVIGEKFQQKAEWEKCGGPPGGLGYDVRIHPYDKNIMFVTDNPSGVSKSYDGGNTWVAKNQGILNSAGYSGDGIPNFSLTIDPSNPDIVWAGMQFARGIYKSTDGGETWVKKDDGITEWNELTVRNFGIDPNNSNIVFAGCEIGTGIQGYEFEKVRGKIYKTEDGGENWHCVWEGDSLIRFVLIDPTNSNIVYASSGIFDREALNNIGIGVLKSTDGGETWKQINNGISNLFVGFLEMHPTNPKVLFAAAGMNQQQRYGYNDGGIFKTVDGGETWGKVLGNDTFTIVTISLSNPNVVYAGSQQAFYRSDDGGNTWQKFWKDEEGCWGPPGVHPGFPISAVIDPDDPMTIFANNYGGGVFKSTDGAKTWINCSNGYTGADLRGIAIDSKNPNLVYCVGRSGTWKSLRGIDWKGITSGVENAEPTGGDTTAIAINPQNPYEIMISTGGGNGRILKSINGGNSWQEVFRHPNADPGDPSKWHIFNTIAYAPSNPLIIYAGMRKVVNIGMIEPSEEPSFGVYISKDGGQSWIEKNSGLESSTKIINTIAVHPCNSDIAYLGTFHDGIFKTTNGGETWIQKNYGLGEIRDVRSLSIDPNNPDIIFAGVWQGGIFKSTDGGETWGACGIGMSPEASILSIVIDPTNSKTIYAGDLHSGVYMSIDSGETWYPINDSLSTRAVTCMAVSADGKVLYAGTSGEGVFKLALETILETIPDIKVNGSDGPVTLSQSDTISLTVALNNNDITDNADWWLAAGAPFGLWFFTFDGWTTDWRPVYQGPLFYLDTYEVFSTTVSGLQEGTYTFYFGVDANMDGNITWDSLYVDGLVVNVTE